MDSKSHIEVNIQGIILGTCDRIWEYQDSPSNAALFTLSNGSQEIFYIGGWSIIGGSYTAQVIVSPLDRDLIPLLPGWKPNQVIEE